MMSDAAAFALPKVTEWAAGILLGGATVFTVYQAVKSHHENYLHTVFAACDLCNVDKHGHPIPWKIIKRQRLMQGTRYVMAFPLGRTLKDVTDKADALSTALGVDVVLGRDGGRLILDVPGAPLPTFVMFSPRLLEMTRGRWRTVVGLGAMDWVIHDFDDRPHLLVAGLTRKGKTTFLANLIATLHLSHGVDDVDLVGIDLKPRALDFRRFPGVWSKLIDDTDDALNFLVGVREEMYRRAALLEEVGVRNARQYEAVTGEKFRRLFIIVDEFANAAKNEAHGVSIKKELASICALGAGFGIHCILCTQRPDREVVDGQIRANIGTVLCFQVSTDIQSRVVLGKNGAERIPPIEGRAIYQTDKEEFVQVPILTDESLRRILPVSGVEYVTEGKVANFTVEEPVANLEMLGGSKYVRPLN